MYTQIIKIVQLLFILKLEPDLDPESETLSEDGAWTILLSSNPVVIVLCLMIRF